MPEVIAEYVDRLCTVEMRPAGGNLPRGVIHRLYDAARAGAGKPLTLALAEALHERVGPGDRVLLLTGAGGPPVLPRGEVDGLLGAAALARALHLGRGAEVVVLTEDRVEEPIRAACTGAGLNFRRLDGPEMQHAVAFVAMPTDDDECKAQAAELLDTSPAAVVAIEKLSPNREGVIHGATGLEYHDSHAKAHHLVEGARERGILTGGIGDGGNEIGFGVIADAVREVMPAGDKCQCPCNGGSAAAVATDHLVVAAISNWGAYGVAAMLGWLVGDRGVLVDADDLERMLRATVDAGAYDGALGRPVLCDDGVPLEAHRSMIMMLHSVLEIGFSDLDSPGH